MFIIYCFLPPQEKNPLTKPVRPAWCCPLSVSADIAWRLLWTLSSNDGNVRWLRAKSKRIGLHGIGLNGGGNETILRRFLLVNDESSK